MRPAARPERRRALRRSCRRSRPPCERRGVRAWSDTNRAPGRRVTSSTQTQRRALLRLGTRSEDAAVALLDRDVVDAGLPASHVPLVVELPLLVAVAAPPLPRHVPALVLEAHRDPVAAERPQILAQRIVELT